MNFSNLFPDLSLPRNQNIPLSPLLTPALAEIWAEFPALTPWVKDELGALPPFYPADARLEQIQILGLNPSLSIKDRDAVVYPVGFDSHPYFRRIQQFGKRITAEHERYFQQSSDDAGQLYHFGELQWGHLDLLYMRTTSQRALEAQVWNTPGAADFVWQQLQLTKRLLGLLQPVAIVVANRFGQRLTGFHKNAQTGADEWMGWQFAAGADAQGAYRITGSTTAGKADPDDAFGLVGTPVFFTGSFAGTNVRNKVADAQLAAQIAATCLLDGNRYFERWYMQATPPPAAPPAAAGAAPSGY